MRIFFSILIVGMMEQVHAMESTEPKKVDQQQRDAQEISKEFGDISKGLEEQKIPNIVPPFVRNEPQYSDDEIIFDGAAYVKAKEMYAQLRLQRRREALERAHMAAQEQKKSKDDTSETTQ